VMRQATTVSRDELVSVGTCFGKFTKSGKFMRGARFFWKTAGAARPTQTPAGTAMATLWPFFRSS